MQAWSFHHVGITATDHVRLKSPAPPDEDEYASTMK
jgi:hypothetical protein